MDICHPNPPGFCSDQPGGIYNPPPRTETPGSEVQLAGGDLVLVTEGVQLGQRASLLGDWIDWTQTYLGISYGEYHNGIYIYI